MFVIGVGGVMAGSIDALGGEIVRLAADMEAAMCRWLDLVAEFDERCGWHEQGCKNCAAWVAWRCGLGGEAARERVRVARRLQEMPLVHAAFSRSELTYSKVRALTRIEDLGDEARMVELARNHTAEQLERMVRAYRGVVRPEDAERAHEDRFLDWSIDPDDGSYRFRGKLSAEQAAVLIKAIEATRDLHVKDVS